MLICIFIYNICTGLLPQLSVWHKAMHTFIVLYLSSSWITCKYRNIIFYVQAEIAKSNERISLLEKSDNERPDVSGIAKNEKQTAINQKEIEVLKLQIQELKLHSNPLKKLLNNMITFFWLLIEHFLSD